jgi:undecaprenyl diphosphate synthase
MNEEKVTLDIELQGRVQGVNFRNSAQKYAESLRLKGFTKNNLDGSVKIRVQGEAEALEEFLTWCQRGSVFAKVEGMNYRWVKDPVVYKEFKVIRSGNFVQDQIKSFFNLGKKVGEEIIKKYDDSTDDNVVPNPPNHVVIIPNGNRRWATERGLKAWESYWYVQKKLESLISTAQDLSIPHFTLWGFSTENWKRNEEEVSQLMKLFESTIDKFRPYFLKEGVRFRHLGRRDRLPRKLIEKFEALESETKHFENRSVNIAIDYGGRDEIIRGIKSLTKESIDSITEEEFAKYLDTQGLPDPDLIIRTAGEKRLSGLMPWQSVYAEIYSTYVYFPDFDYEHFKEAIYEYSLRKRTFGGDGKDRSKELDNMTKNIQKYT